MPAAGNMEKRIDTRAEIMEEAKYKILSDSDPRASLNYETAKTKNISKGGVCLVTTHKINEGNVIRLELPVVSSSAKSIKAFCEVQWCQKTSADDTFEIGLSFIALKEEDAEHLNEYITAQTRAM